MTDTAGIPVGRAAGWYRDPYEQSVVRWWDGSRWSGNTQAAPPLEAVPQPVTPRLRATYAETAQSHAAHSQASGPAAATRKARPREKHRIFLWCFASVQVIFIIWLVVGIHGNATAISPTVVHQCHEPANLATWGSVQACENALGAAAKAGTGLGVAAIIIRWILVNGALGFFYGLCLLRRAHPHVAGHAGEGVRGLLLVV